MKNFLCLLFVTISISSFSQIPTYYNDVNLQLKGTNLKNELATKIISTHTKTLSYTPGVWKALKKADLAPNNKSKVVLLYGYNDDDRNTTNDRTRSKNQNGGGIGKWNREHTYPKSLANPNLGTSGAGADAHNLRPCDIKRNSIRSNKKFEDGKGNSKVTARGNWYPGDEWKGDVARMMMYMYLRYGNQTLPKRVAVGSKNNKDANMVNLFLKWNAEDPVSKIELQRNTVLEKIQGNRNPFIDNPAFATFIWGGPKAENRFQNKSPQKILNKTILSYDKLTYNSIKLSWKTPVEAGIVRYIIYQNKKEVATSTTSKIAIAGLAKNSSYTFSVRGFDYVGELCAVSNTLPVKTPNKYISDATTTTATDLIISEYIEGSSYNKALEIANFTDKTIDLSNYSLKKATNGSGKFTTTLHLKGKLNNKKVIVIANNKAHKTILNKTDITNGSLLNFNGNDAIGLFKNNRLIDLLGNITSKHNFAKNISLRRKASVNSPNKNYIKTEWISFKTDTFNGLKTHHLN